MGSAISVTRPFVSLTGFMKLVALSGRCVSFAQLFDEDMRVKKKRKESLHFYNVFKKRKGIA